MPNISSSMKIVPPKIPLVYSCSGCSCAAQMANYLAVQLDRKGLAEMSCIAGVGGQVKKLVRSALSARKIVAIDGCALGCSKACLAIHKIKPTLQIQLSNYKIKKHMHLDFDLVEANDILTRVEAAVYEIRFIREGELGYNSLENK